MDNNEKKMCDGLPDFLKDILEGKKKHVETPSEKITKLSIEREMTYDKIEIYKKKIETDKQNGGDTLFTEMQVKQLEIYKNMLGDQIKKFLNHQQKRKNTMEEEANIGKFAAECDRIERDEKSYREARLRRRDVNDVLTKLARERETLSSDIFSLQFALGIENPPWSEKHGELMKKQLNAMLEYRAVLGERIKDIVDHTNT